ncbi:E3 ubiquitin-protein ligase LRSAM1-like isoform X2 [Tetranychus urticae]|uniref:E3 ubiquitin-protein ligase LRSAM1-like isoform X2 n=1 Tax=Tetranychus urticae TaxID=32264 RepID=UPI00077C09FE|nr:E3 ubiquitin-protein ligase LRSAM1-like isoform X2 [Tetranychus urticae]
MRNQEAQINPGPDFDLSNCALQCVPKGIYSQCRVFRKESLLLNNNNLTTIPDDHDNCLDDLVQCLKILNVSKNAIRSLPCNISKLVNLKELNLSNNMLKSLPDSFVGLKGLESLDISHNQLKQFPLSICGLPALKYINISHNQMITHIPAEICNLINLERLLIDETSIKHPPRRICDKGIESLFKFFNGDVLKNDQIEVYSKNCSQASSHATAKESIPEDTLQAYLTKKDDRKKRLIEFEQRLLDENKFMKITNNIDKRQEILNKMKQDQMMLHKDLEAFNLKKIEDKSIIMEALNLVENHSAKLLDHLSCIDLSSKCPEHKPTNETSGHQDGLIVTLEEKIRQLMISKDETKKILQSELVKEDESLYRAICNFMNMKNTQSRILSEQIALIENELYHLTKTELQTNSFADSHGFEKANFATQMNSINEQRIALASVLKELLNEKQSKSSESEKESKIIQALTEDLATSAPGFMDDVCLKRLMEDLDESLVQLYLPIFTSGSVTFKQLAEGTDDELKLFGIEKEHIPIIRKHISLCKSIETISPKAPQSETVTEPSAPPMKLWYLIECVVCLDELSKIIFIPCGHVCACIECSSSVDLCPICRAEISEKIR